MKKRTVLIVLFALVFAAGFGVAVRAAVNSGETTTSTVIPFSTNFTIPYTIPPPSTVTVTATASTGSSTTTDSTTTTPAPTAYAHYGIQDGAYINDGHLTPAQQTFYLDEAQRSGAKLYRFGYRAGQDTSTGTCTNCVSNDAMMNRLAARNLEPLLVLGTSVPNTSTCSAAASRYPLVRLFEVGNEPNIHGYNGTSYEPYLKNCYQAVKAANPSAKVLIGGLSYAFQGTNTSPINFMSQLYSAGGGPYFDIANVHPYNDPLSHWTTSGYSCQNGGASLWDQTWGNSTYCSSGYIRQIMDNHGDSSKPIVATEAGDKVGKVTESAQATIVQHALQDSRPAFMIIYSNDDLEVTGFGIHRTDQSRRPAFAAMQGVTGGTG